VNLKDITKFNYSFWVLTFNCALTYMSLFCY